MSEPVRMPTKVHATVTEVLPSFGLAYLAGDDERAWTVTKSTPGAGLTALLPGQRVSLTLTRHPDFAVVSDYAPLD